MSGSREKVWNFGWTKKVLFLMLFLSAFHPLHSPIRLLLTLLGPCGALAISTLFRLLGK